MSPDELPPEARGTYRLGLVSCSALGAVGGVLAMHTLGAADLIAFVLPGAPGIWAALAGVAIGVWGWWGQRPSKSPT